MARAGRSSRGSFTFGIGSDLRGFAGSSPKTSSLFFLPIESSRFQNGLASGSRSLRCFGSLTFFAFSALGAFTAFGLRDNESSRL